MPGLEKFQSALITIALKVTEPRSEEEWKKFTEVVKNNILDLGGPTVFRSGLSQNELFLRKMTWGFFEITGSYERLLDIETYITKFPFRKSRVTKTRYLRFIFEAYLQEIYILRERLISFLTIIARSFRKTSRNEHVNKVSTMLSKMVIKSFDKIIAIRGFHVHSYRYSEKDFDILNSLEVMTNLEPDVDTKLTGLLKSYYEISHRTVRKKSHQRIKENNAVVRKILDAFFESLFMVLFDRDGNVIFPNKTIKA